MTFVSQGVSVRYLAGDSEALATGRGPGTPVGFAPCHASARLSASRHLRRCSQGRSLLGVRARSAQRTGGRSSFAHFACGQRVWVRSDAPSDFDVREVICRARSRVGEDRYRLLTNNCEHFCEWCLRGTARSFQIEAWLARPRLTLLATLRLIILVPMSSLLH